MKGFFKAWLEVFARSARFALYCPLLFLIPLAVELVQHWAEIHIGLYDSIAQAKATEHHPLRMGIGHLKILSLTLLGYWAMRFMAFGDDPREAVRLEGAAVRLYLWVLLWQAGWTLLLQDVLPYAPLPLRMMAIVTAGLMIGNLVLELCLSAWKAAAALGNPRITFLRSLAMIRGSFWWGLALTLLTVLPLLVLHYVAFGLALGRGPAVVWGIMAADSVLTAYLGVVMVAATYVIAKRMAERHGEVLTK